MPFPESPREVYRRNPLKEVLCQLRFPTVLQITSESPADFQNAVRKRYPLYGEDTPSTGLPKEISEILAALSIPKQIHEPVHKFSTEDELRFISLNQEFLAMTETQYTEWACFRKELKSAEEALSDIYAPAFYTRIGLRYQDVIDKNELSLEKYEWRDLLNESFLGELGTPILSDHIDQIRTETLIRLQSVPGGIVKIRHGLAKSSETDQDLYLIDQDFFVETKRSTSDEAFSTLDEFNRLGGRLFRWAIKRKLRVALEPDIL
jgi:uncharacterized protein (TIGR04255 family)